MTPAEYIQLKAFARVDGAYLGVVWTVSFVCYVCGLANPPVGMIGSVIAIASPFFAAVRLRKFRDNARDGVISFRRAAAYYVLMFFYASLIFALVQYVYFAFIDGGYLVDTYAAVMQTPEAAEMMKAYGVTQQQIGDAIAQMRGISPIYIVFNILTLNLTVGVIMSLPAAGLMKRSGNSGGAQS